MTIAEQIRQIMHVEGLSDELPLILRTRKLKVKREKP